MIDLSKLPELPPKFHWGESPTYYVGVFKNHKDDAGLNFVWCHWWYSYMHKNVKAERFRGRCRIVANDIGTEEAIAFMATMCQLGVYGDD